MNASLRPVRSANELRPTGRIRRLFWLTVLTGLIAACQPVQYTDYERERVSAAGQEAAGLSARGQHQAAAERYLQLAQRTSGPQRQRYLILVANERRLAGYPEVAQTILDRLGTPIADANRLLWSQVAAEVSIAMGDAEQALEHLDLAPRTTNAATVANLLQIRANALFRVGRPVEATRALIEREVWLQEPDAIFANQQLLWDSYKNWGGDIGTEVVTPDDDPILRGWLELGVIAWTRGNNSASMRVALANWRTANPGHPATRVLLPEILDGLPVIREFPRHVALLLPLSGRQKLSATAVRDGFLAAHFSAGDQKVRPVIQVYDVAAMGVAEAYRLALAEGADFVVGPLLKESVRQLLQVDIIVPTLALNFLADTDGSIPAFYQFALSPEDEARQVAQRASALGQTRALTLSPSNAWGRRVLNSFREEFEASGGQILSYETYDPNGLDFSFSIQELLLINESEARRDRLAANLNIELEFEPRRRTDIDLIFLAATADAGKLIRPQLRFYYAGSVPTYATSAIFEEGSRNNVDLNGIMFPDIPWIIAPDGQSVQLRQTLATHWPKQAERRARLYAMGFDAYRLIPVLNSGAAYSSAELQGMTGALHIDDKSRVLRRLPWARIQRGRPVLMDPLPTQQASPSQTIRDNEWLSTSKSAKTPNE